MFDDPDIRQFLAYVLMALMVVGAGVMFYLDRKSQRRDSLPIGRKKNSRPRRKRRDDSKTEG